MEENDITKILFDITNDIQTILHIIYTNIYNTVNKKDIEDVNLWINALNDFNLANKGELNDKEKLK